MLNRILSPDGISQLEGLLDSSKYIVITCHISPDGDAMGSSLALCRALTNIGKKVKVVVPDRSEERRVGKECVCRWGAGR